MSFLNLFMGLQEELLGYLHGVSQASAVKVPPLLWTLKTAVRVLRSYPAGLTRAVLLTELEAQWRASILRGEHAGKLKFALANKDASSSEVFSGSLVSLDSYRYEISSEGVSAVLLLHRRFADFLAFVKYYKFDFFAQRSGSSSSSGSGYGRGVSFTQLRFLKASKIPLILPTEFAIFEIDTTSSTSDRALIEGPLASFHSQFCIQPSYSDDVMQGCFVVVKEVSSVRSYPTPRAKEYVIVTLSLMHKSFPIEMREPNMGVVVLILFDDQVYMAPLLRSGMVLWIHRPCLTRNTEEPVFGMQMENSSTNHIRGMSMHATIMFNTATPIKKYLIRHTDDPQSSGAAGLLPFHIIIGAITCISQVVGIGPTELSRSWTYEDKKILPLEATKSTMTTMPLGGQLSIIVRVLAIEMQLVRISDQKGPDSKCKYKRRLVMWCVKESETPWQSLLRVVCRVDDAKDAQTGSILCLCNYVIAAVYSENEVPLHILPRNAAVLFSDSCVPLPIYILHSENVLEKDLTQFQDLIDRERGKLNYTTEISNLATMSSTHFDLQPVTSDILNLSRISAFATSSSIMPTDSRGILCPNNTACIELSIQNFVSTQLIHPELFRPIETSGAKRKLETTLTSPDSVNFSQPPIDADNKGTMVSAILRVVDRNGEEALALFGPRSVNMSSKELPEIPFLSETKSVPFLSAFVVRVDDITSPRQISTENTDYRTPLVHALDTSNSKIFRLSTEDRISYHRNFSVELPITDMPDIQMVCSVLKSSISYSGPIYYLESVADIVTSNQRRENRE